MKQKIRSEQKAKFIYTVLDETTDYIFDKDLVCECRECGERNHYISPERVTVEVGWYSAFKHWFGEPEYTNKLVEVHAYYLRKKKSWGYAHNDLGKFLLTYYYCSKCYKMLVKNTK